MSIEDDSDEDEYPFEKCDECGSIYPKMSGHHCDEGSNETVYITSAEALRRRERITASDKYDPDTEVLTGPVTRKIRAYHKPKSPMNRVPQCSTTAHQDWELVSQSEAHARDRYPCGHCWPEFVGDEINE